MEIGIDELPEDPCTIRTYLPNLPLYRAMGVSVREKHAILFLCCLVYRSSVGCSSVVENAHEVM